MYLLVIVYVLEGADFIGVVPSGPTTAEKTPDFRGFFISNYIKSEMDIC